MTELAVKNSRVEFSLPDFVTSAADEIFNKLTQTDVDTIFTDLDGACMPFTAVIGITMPREILDIETSHSTRTKQTVTIATLEVVPQPFRRDDGPFTLHVAIADASVPRLWVEDTDDGHRACMLAVTPEFSETTSGELRREPVIVALDASCSMKEEFEEAQKVASLVLAAIPDGVPFNLAVFGTGVTYLFPSAQPKTEHAIQHALAIVAGAHPSRGSTNLVQIVRGLALLNRRTSLVVITDGQISLPESLVRETAAASRLRVFMCGVGKNCDRHFVRRCARTGRGVPYFFDSAIKSKWASDVETLVQNTQSPCLSNIRIEWHQHSDNLEAPQQAPVSVKSLYSKCRTIVYAFAENCTSCTIHAEHNGIEMSTIVSTSELAIVKGNLIHTLAARAIVRDWEDGSQTSNAAQDKADKERRKSEIVNVSVKYQVGCPFNQ